LREPRWYHHDDDGASTTPDETDFYFYDTIDRLEKAVYGGTKYGSGGGTGITLSNVHSAFATFADDTDNAGTFSDRVFPVKRSAFHRYVRFANCPPQGRHARATTGVKHASRRNTCCASLVPGGGFGLGKRVGIA
jgi:hypothetical protein